MVAGMRWTDLLLAVALGLLAHALIGYQAFPYGDDFAYAPLADYRADPSLFPRDVQLRMFENHALVYEGLYHVGTSGPGVEPSFRVAIWVQAALTAVALLAMLSALGVPVSGLPLVLGLGVVVVAGGMGRGEYGGLIPSSFHHHNVALMLVVAAITAGFRRKTGLAGGLLGLAAYAQPMTALHGALAAGLAALPLRASGVVRMALVAAVVAAPVAFLVVGSIATAPPSTTTLNLIDEVYRFRAPHHYDPPLRGVIITSLYLLAGWAGAALLARDDTDLSRAAAGLMAAFTILHLVTVIVYQGGFAAWVPLFILDANRSTPLLFALGPALAVAGLWRTPWRPASWAVAILLAELLVLNGTLESLALVALAGIMIPLRTKVWMKPLTLGVLSIALLLWFPPKAAPTTVSAPTRAALDRIRTETPPDALFVIPVALYPFRYYAQRSAYVDFKLFSVAQPDQAALTRARINEVMRPDPAQPTVAGWDGIALWEEYERRVGTCEGMAEILRSTGADYYLRSVAPDETPPDCPDLPLSIQTETLALYGPPSVTSAR